MGLCLSKRDVLIQKPQLSLRDQMLGSDLHLRAAAGHFIPDSPSMTSIISADSSSIAEKQLLKNSSMRSSISNIAECGSRSSIGDWRFGQQHMNHRAVAASDDDGDDQSSTCGPRTSGVSYLSSPMIEGIDFENINRSYQRAKERYEIEGFTSFNPRLLEINEEHEDLDDSDAEESARAVTRKKTLNKSLHVFGEVFPHNNKVAMSTITPRMKNNELGVFGASDHITSRAASLRMEPPPPKVSVFKQPPFDSDFSCSEVESEHVHPNGRSARWGFVVDSSGSDEMEGDETTEASRMSSSSTNFDTFCRSAPSSRFMAVPPPPVRNVKAESWQHQPNFSHMNLAPKTVSKPEDPTGFYRGFAAAPLVHKAMPRSFDFAASSSSSLSDSSSEENVTKSTLMRQVHLNPNIKPGTTLSDEDDDGNDSDSSNDLFEIENLGAALGSLSSFSDNKEFIYPAMNNAFLKDPDISYSSVTKVGQGKSSFQFQGGHKGGKILGPTLRANVVQSSSAKQHKSDSTRKSFSRPLKKKSAVENDTLLFYGR